jgi:hypothetical protein
MKQSIIVAFAVFVVSLLVSVVLGLYILWYDPAPNSPGIWRILATSLVIMLAALFYVPVGEAMNRVLSASPKQPSRDEH